MNRAPALLIMTLVVSTARAQVGPSLTAVGSGCPTAAALIPGLWANSLPWIGNQNFQITCSNVPTGTGCLLFGAIGPASPPFNIGNNCNVYLDPLSMVGLIDLGISPLGPIFPDPFGSAAFALPIPISPPLAGLTLSFQAVVLNPAGPHGLSLSNAVEVRFN